ncbi:hypothetical protein [Candidatus Enterovibrio escicola]|nr:hypothetical protein [Candidatus Enterovibrio escacola]
MQLWDLVFFLCVAQVNYNTQISEAWANEKSMNKVIRLGIPVYQQTN